MRNELDINGILICLFTGVLILFGTLVSYGSYGLDYYISNEFVVSLLILIIFALKEKINLLIVPKKYFAWHVLLVVALISEIVCSRVHVINLLSMLILVVVLARMRVHIYKLLVYSIIIAQLVFFFQYRITSYFNSYALTTALVGVEIMILLYVSEKVNLNKMIVVFLAFFLLLFIMASRTSLLAFAVAGVVIIMGSLKKIKTNRFIVICAVVFIGLIALWRFYDVLYSFLLNKWGNAGYSGKDVTSGRMTMWVDIVKNRLTAFGHTDSFIPDTYHHQDLHNIFVQVIGKYGVICFVFFIIMIIDLIKRIFSLDKFHRIIFFAFYSFYFIAGMAENVLFLDCKVFMIAFAFCLNTAWLYNISSNNSKHSSIE